MNGRDSRLMAWIRGWCNQWWMKEYESSKYWLFFNSYVLLNLLINLELDRLITIRSIKWSEIKAYKAFNSIWRSWNNLVKFKIWFFSIRLLFFFIQIAADLFFNQRVKLQIMEKLRLSLLEYIFPNHCNINPESPPANSFQLDLI